MTPNLHGGGTAALFAAFLIYMAHAAAAAPASAMQILEAADHAELSARVSASEVSRIALVDDRIARVIRSPGGFETEHDPASGDLYLRPLDAVPGEEEPPAPAVLFVGTEKGFTYRLTLNPAEGGSAQVLIRNPDAAAKVEAASAGDPRIGALVRLIGAVARREPLPGYAIEAGASRTAGGFAVVETWRGPRLTALIVSLRADGARDAAAVAARLGPGIAAAWVSPPGSEGGRFAVAVRASAGESR